ncbi:MAG: class I SAM-dependent methyltransferase [Planctomycetales bacterium]|nr:class I SAM-dependent methyltransferase [Planctomycetales bacterium]
MVKCALCSSVSTPWRVIDGYQLWDCQGCGHRFTCADSAASHVAATYSDDYFFGGGAGYPDYLAESSLLTKRGAWYAELVSKHGEPGSVLELGAAAGFTLQAFRDAGWSAVGLEPNATMAEYGREELGLDLRTGSLEECEVEDPFDLVLLLQVVAHLVDPKGDLERAASLVRPGGYFLVETWDRSSPVARALGARWHEYSPPSVLHWFSRDSLDALFQELGCEPVAGGRPKKRISGAHLKSLLRHASGRSMFNRALRAASAPVPDGLCLPYPSWDLFWRLYRKVNLPAAEER